MKSIPLSALSFDSTGSKLEVQEPYKNDTNIMLWLKYLVERGVITPAFPRP